MDWTPIIVSVITSGGALVGAHIAHKKSNKEIQKIKEETRPMRHWFKKRNERVISILMIDNDPADIEFVSRRLLKAGHKIESFETEEDYRARIDDNENIHIVDIYLNKQSGIELAKEVKKRNQNNQIIMLSAHKTETLLFTMLNAGVDKFVYKNDSDYLDQIEMYVNEAWHTISNL